MKTTSKIFWGATLVLITAQASLLANLSIEQARVAITGFDVNPPDFVGWGGTTHGFGWPGGLVQLPNGELLFFHSAGYWHASKPKPYNIPEETDKLWRSKPSYNWPYEGPAPRGGRIMLCRSRDGGQTWSKPETVMDTKWDERSVGALLGPDGTLLCFAVVQGSWVGLEHPPKGSEKDSEGLSGRTAVTRSTDNGKTWSEPMFMESPGKLQENGQSPPIFLSKNKLLWATYAADLPKKLFGALRRSDDQGESWTAVTTLQRDKISVDEPALCQLKNGQLLLVSRPDGALFKSSDEGKNWQHFGSMVDTTRRLTNSSLTLVAAPRLEVLDDGTVVCLATYLSDQGRHGLHAFLSQDHGKTWSKPFPIAPESYGYPATLKLRNDTILVCYTHKSMPPSRIYAVRMKVNGNRDGVDLLPMSKPAKR